MSELPNKMKQTYQQGFHSQREETTHSLEAKPNRIDHLNKDSPAMHLQFAIYHTVRTLLLQFKQALKLKGYKCISMGEKQLLIIRLTLCDRFKKLFLCSQPPKFILTVNTHQFLSVRTVTLKPLKSNSVFSQVIPIQELNNQVEKIAEMLLVLPNLQCSGVVVGEENQYRQDFFSLDATSYYMFSRMLVDGNYSLGQKMLSVLSKLKDEQRVEDCSKDDLYWLHQALSEVSTDLLQGFNCSRKELLEILAYCRKSVQQYFYNIHHQYQANSNRPSPLESLNYSDQLRQLQRIAPQTLKQFLILERAKTSMDILKAFFTVGLIFKAEIQVMKISEEDIYAAISLIRQVFSGIINQKSRLLKSFGYDDENFQPYIGRFNFDHEVTF